MKSIPKICHDILKEWDAHVIISVSGFPLDNSYAVPCNEITFEGRCKDFTSLRTKKSDVDMFMNEKYSFICMKYFMLPMVDNSCTQSVTIQVEKLSDIGGLKSSTYANSGSYSVNLLLEWLKKMNISVVFCGDSVDDDVVYLAAASGVTLVKNVYDAYC